MYICPTCGKQFADEDKVVKHYMLCWKEQHPYHKAKAAPRSEDINTRQVSNEIENFFKELSCEKK